MTQRAIGSALALFGLAIVVMSMQLPQPLAATRIDYGPGFFPLILGFVIAVAGALLALARPRVAEGEQDGERFELRDFAKPLIVFLAALTYIFFAQKIGFLIIAPIILTGLLLLGRVRAPTAFVTGVAGSVVVYFVFAKLLLVPLPLGLMTPWGAYL